MNPPRPLLAALTGTLLVSTGCRPDEDQFMHQYTRQVCKLYKNCTSWFEDIYGDVDKCRADLEDDLFLVAGCDYSEKFGKDCLAALRAADCDGFEDGAWFLACEDVYVCD